MNILNYIEDGEAECQSGASTSAQLSRIHTRGGRLLRKMTSEPQISMRAVMLPVRTIDKVVHRYIYLKVTKKRLTFI